MEIINLLVIGLAAGILSGLLGVGGATIIIPALIYIFNVSQHMAQGTALGAMLLPVGLLAAIKYWQAGNVNVKFAALIAVGFFVGGLIGATLVQPIPDIYLRKFFGIFFLIISIRMIFWG
jgi:hypothetical protein